MGDLEGDATYFLIYHDPVHQKYSILYYQSDSNPFWGQMLDPPSILRHRLPFLVSKFIIEDSTPPNKG